MRYHEVLYDDRLDNPGWFLRADVGRTSDWLTCDIPLDTLDPGAPDDILLADVRAFFGTLDGHHVEVVR